MYFSGGKGLSTATRSGLQSKPCCILPIVKGNDPPPCAKATLNEGSFSNTPPNIIEQIALDVSAGMPTSQGSQYFCICFSPIISHGCTKTAMPDSAHAWKTGNRFSSLRFHSFTCEPICTPFNPICLHRSSSLIASDGDCIGSVPKPINRF